MDTSDANEQREEVEVLRAIFGEEEIVSTPSGITIPLGSVPPSENGVARPDVFLQVDFPHDYPSQSAPVPSLLNWPTSEDFESELKARFQNQPVVFEWVEMLRGKVDAFRALETAKIPTVGSSCELTEAAEVVRAAVSLAGAEETRGHAITHGEPFVFKKSTFQAHAAQVQSLKEVQEVLRQLLQNGKILKATHNMRAFRIEREGGVGFICDNDDDGENAAGSKLAHLLEILDARNVVVVVSRWYGGVQLGPTRFKIINNVARQLLVAEGFVAG